MHTRYHQVNTRLMVRTTPRIAAGGSIERQEFTFIQEYGVLILRFTPRQLCIYGCLLRDRELVVLCQAQRFNNRRRALGYKIELPVVVCVTGEIEFAALLLSEAVQP